MLQFYEFFRSPLKSHAGPSSQSGNKISTVKWLIRKWSTVLLRRNVYKVARTDAAVIPQVGQNFKNLEGGRSLTFLISLRVFCPWPHHKISDETKFKVRHITDPKYYGESDTICRSHVRDMWPHGNFGHMEIEKWDAERLCELIMCFVIVHTKLRYIPVGPVIRKEIDEWHWVLCPYF